MKFIPSRLMLSAVACMVLGNAAATEGGGDTYPLGAEGVMAGALPPPGVYLLGYYQNYHASRFVDKHGKSSIPGFGVNVNAFIPRLVWMTNTQLLGGQLGFYTALPLVDLRVGMMGQRDDRRAMGDAYLASMIGWHSGAHHWGVAVETVLPTGEYDRDHMANAGKNYYTVRPMFGYSYSEPDGWDISTKLSYSFNSRNNDTDYKSGQYFAGDYSVGYRVKPNVTLALEGYAFKQMTSDNVAGEDIGFRGQVFAYGPGVHYQAKGWSVEAKYLRETAVENRAQGNSTFVKFVWAF
ncbi:transporter [Pseudomonas aeruginosa]|jgi:hypothetical protein|nr:transporter [Pseudomonas aeruginosa]MCS9139067.1 transporter [Pseudomonas aeruginosa]MCS9211952.1 transporter [Pseudomonas aeruginosa]